MIVKATTGSITIVPPAAILPHSQPSYWSLSRRNASFSQLSYRPVTTSANSRAW